MTISTLQPIQLLNNDDPQGLQLAAAAAAELGRRAEWDRDRQDPWAWIQRHIYLLDPLASGSQIARFPNFEYLRLLINEIHTYNAVMLWKSRRMIASWTALVYSVWLGSLFKNQRIFYLSRKEGETDGEGCRELIWRTKWLIDHLDMPVRPIYESGKLWIRFEDTGSTITGMSSESDAMRSVSANLVIGDEMGFWQRPRDTYAALKPTLEARGKFIGISSSAEGFFKEIVLDTTESAEPTRGGITATPGVGVVLSRTSDVVDDEEYQPLPRTQPETSVGAPVTGKGFAAWTNKRNKFRIVAIHYSADPRKDAAWKAAESVGVPLSIWLKEYEMQFGSATGAPVYLHEWRPQTMLLQGVKTERTRPILCSLDFGYHHPALLVGQMRYGLQLCALRAFQGRELRFEDFMSQALAQLAQWFPQRSVNTPGDFLWCCDCSGDQEQSTGSSEIKILRRVFNLKPKFKKVKIPPTIDIVRGYMSRTYRGEPCFLVDNNDSMHLFLDALNGGYAYPEGEVNEDTKPDKDNVHDHLMDCLRYMAVNFGSIQSPTSRSAFDRAAKSDILVPIQYI